MRIGILTLYYKNYNYGGLLQAYALQKILQKYGVDCEQICVDILFERTDLKAEKSICYRIRKAPWRIWKAVKWLNIVKHVVKKHMSEREKAFCSFEKQIPHSQKIYNKDNYRELADLYDIIVVGSDQVWGNWIPDDVFRIYTAEDGFGKSKIVSYAASISSQEVSDTHKKMLQRNLRHFSYISVREETARKQLEELFPAKEIDVVCDPVLLLTKDDWDQIAKAPNICGKYIFCYFLGQTKWHRDLARRIADQKRIPIVYFPYIKSQKLNFQELTWGDIRNYDADPTEFVGLIKNAEMVITDSFHAMVFSVIYRKHFYILLRSSMQSKNSMNDRIFDFVNRFGLEKCLIKEKAQTGDMVSSGTIACYQRTEQQMIDQRTKAMNYMNEMLTQSE